MVTPKPGDREVAASDAERYCSTGPAGPYAAAAAQPLKIGASRELHPPG
jgi:hypothetical protein